MIKLWTKRAVVALALIGAPTAAFAQTPAAAEPSAAGAQLQAWFNEMQAVGQQIGPMQMAVMEDPTIKAEEEAISAQIRIAMEAIDPMMNSQMARMRALETEIGAAQGAGNGELFTQLMGERQAIQQHYMTVQESALAEPAIAARVSEFQKQVEVKIIETNPEAQALIARFHELEALIEQAMVAGGA